jgi:DNA-binding response OmpR family regulator
MNGTEFAQRYREQGGHAPIVVITAARGVEQEAAECDPCAFLAKPFDLEALLETISACGPMAGAGR